MRKTAILASLLALTLAPALHAAAPQPPRLNGYSVRGAPIYVDARVLSAGVAKSVTAPTFPAEPAARVTAIFSTNCPDYYLASGRTAAEPTVDVSDGTASERNPAALQFAQGDAYSMEAPTSCKVTITYYLSS